MKSAPRQLSPLAILAFVFMISVSLFLLVELFPSLLYHTMDIAPYLVFHNIAEVFSIMVSFSIFGVGWFTYEQSKNRHALFLSCAFLAIGLMDFMHTLSFPGMPSFITPSSMLKSTQLWIAVRMYAAVMFLASAFIDADTRNRLLSRQVLLPAALAVTGLVFVGAVFYPSKLPATFIQDKGLTSFKIYSEYLIIILLACSIPAYWRRYAKTGTKQLMYYMAAFLVCIFSELAFTVYKSTFDTYNMLGHIYKAAAFALIYRGIFAASVRYPYVKLVETAEKLREHEALLSEYQRTGQVGSYDWNAATDTIWWSDEYYRIYGLDPSIPPPNYAEHLKAYTPESAARLDLAVKRVMEPSEPCEYEVDLELAVPTASTKWILTRGVAKRDANGKFLGLAGTVQDFTERKNAEAELRTLYAELEQRVSERTADLNEKTLELEQANAKLKELDRLKSLFIASMSHELRTPLNSIIGFSSVILDEWVGPVNAEQKENLAIILRSGKHLLTLINDVIDVSKIEAGIIEPVPEQFDLRDLIEEAISLIKQELEKKGVALRIDAPPQQMYTDRCRLLQCVLNLLSNAVKFTKHGGVTVETRVKGPGEMPEACSAEIAVTDTGVGIREEDLPRMFQPFVRLVTPGEVTVPGTGLGLYLSRKLAAEILKGDILLTSEYGKGSRFVLKVPVRLP